MDDAANPTPSPSTPSAAAVQHQQLQRQLFMMQQAQAQVQAQTQGPSHSHPQQLSQQAMSRFPSNIDAHLRPLGPLRFQQPQPQPQLQPQPQGPSTSPSQPPPPPPQQQQHQAAAAAAAAAQAQAQVPAQARGRSPEMEMALQDAMRVCNPDIKTPFQSIEDAVNRCVRIAPKLSPLFFRRCGLRSTGGGGNGRFRMDLEIGFRTDKWSCRGWNLGISAYLFGPLNRIADYC